MLPKESDEITLHVENKRRLEALNKVVSDSTSKNKSTYSSWVKYFKYGGGAKKEN